jgi:hypothetical protein
MTLGREFYETDREKLHLGADHCLTKCDSDEEKEATNEDEFQGNIE